MRLTCLKVYAEAHLESSLTNMMEFLRKNPPKSFIVDVRQDFFIYWI